MLTVSSMLFSGIAQAQKGVCVYKDSEYDGPRRCFEQSVRDFSKLGINDQISSFQLHGNVGVIFYEHTNFRGANKEFYSAESVLSGGMNDNFSSMKIIRHRQSLEWGDRGNWGFNFNPDNEWNNDDDDYEDTADVQGLACLYPERNFKGREFCFSHDDPRFEIFGFDNKADSLRIQGDIEVELFQHSDYKGFSRIFRESARRFRPEEHDQFSAIRIRKRNSNEPKGVYYGIDQACLFPDHYYVGQPYCFSKDMPRFANIGFDNKADSIRLEGDIEVILYQHENYTGYSRVFRKSIPKFTGRDHDQYSSIRIRKRH